MRNVIMAVGPANVTQTISDNAIICYATSLLIKAEFPSIYWTLVLYWKNSVACQQCSWITQIVDDVTYIGNFILGALCEIANVQRCNSLQLVSVVPTKFALSIVILKRFRSL